MTELQTAQLNRIHSVVKTNQMQARTARNNLKQCKFAVCVEIS